MQRQRDRPHPAHQRAGDARADRGPHAVQEEHGGVAGEDLVLRQVVDEVRDHDRIYREGHAAVEEEPRQRDVLDVAEERHRDRGERGAEGRDGEREAAVAGVGEAPHRPLQQRAADDRGGHQQADPGLVEADALAIHRGQAPERPHRQAGGQRAHVGRGRRAPGHPEAQAHARGDLRLREARHRHRQQRQADEHGRDREQGEAGRRVQAQQLLGAGERGEVHDHVGREHLAAALGRGLVVEPALDHRVEADQAHAGQYAQPHPEPGMDDERVQQDAGRDGGAEEGEGADMAHAPDQLGGDEGAEEEAEEVGRADQAQRGLGEAFEVAAQRHHSVEQAGAEQEQGDAGEQCADRDEGGQHGRAPQCCPSRVGAVAVRQKLVFVQTF